MWVRGSLKPGPPLQCDIRHYLSLQEKFKLFLSKHNTHFLYAQNDISHASLANMTLPHFPIGPCISMVNLHVYDSN